MVKTRASKPSPKTEDDCSSSDNSSDSESETELTELVTKSLEDLDDSESSSSDEDVSDNEEDDDDGAGGRSSGVVEKDRSNIFIDRGHGVAGNVESSHMGISESEELGEEMTLPGTSEKKTEETKEKRSKKEEQSKWQRYKLASSLDPGMEISECTYINVNAFSNPKTIEKILPTKRVSAEDQLMQKSVLKPGYEKQHALPTYDESLRNAKRERKIQRAKDNGRGWFNMPAQEMTEEKKNDLTVLRMRNVLDPKRFYKGFDTPALPKFFHRGRVVESAADFYSSRIPKKQRKATLVDELLADSEFRRKNKQKCVEINKKMKASGKLKHRKGSKGSKRR